MKIVQYILNSLQLSDADKLILSDQHLSKISHDKRLHISTSDLYITFPST